MKTAKTNAHFQHNGFMDATEMVEFLNLYVYNNNEPTERTLQKAAEDGHSEKQIKFLRLHLMSRDEAASRAERREAKRGEHAAEEKEESKADMKGVS